MSPKSCGVPAGDPLLKYAGRSEHSYYGPEYTLGKLARWRHTDGDGSQGSCTSSIDMSPKSCGVPTGDPLLKYAGRSGHFYKGPEYTLGKLAPNSQIVWMMSSPVGYSSCALSHITTGVLPVWSLRTSGYGVLQRPQKQRFRSSFRPQGLGKTLRSETCVFWLLLRHPNAILSLPLPSSELALERLSAAFEHSSPIWAELPRCPLRSCAVYVDFRSLFVFPPAVNARLAERAVLVQVPSSSASPERIRCEPFMLEPDETAQPSEVFA